MSTGLPVRRPLHEWSRLYVRLVWAYEGMPQRVHYASREVASVMAWLIQRGEVEAAGVKSGVIRARAGEWLFLPEDKNRHDFTHDAHIISVRLIARWPTGQPLYRHDRWVRFPSGDFPLLERRTTALVRTVRPYLSKAKSSTTAMKVPARLADFVRIEQATLGWLATYDSTMQSLGFSGTLVSRIDERVSHAIHQLEDMPLNEPLDEKAFAQSYGLSVGQLNRLFTVHVGTTLKGYVEQLRLDHARRLLFSTSIPVKQLAYALGFKQPSHFSNWFRKKTGVYPRAFRQMGHHPSALVQ